MAVSCAIIQARSTAEYAMTLPIALMPPSATPIATTSLMVNCLRLRLLMVSVSINPANGQSNRRRGHTVAHRPCRSCEFEHTGGPKSDFCGGRHTALPFAPVGTTGSAVVQWEAEEDWGRARR